MATKTKNLNLTLPSYEDAADVSILNQNFERLDQSALIWGLNVTATITEDGILEFTGKLPIEKQGLTIHFTAPAAATEGLQAKFAGSEVLYPILSTSEGKEPVSAGAWDVGVPVSLTVSGGSCFFKAAGGVNDTLPAQVGSLKAVSNLVSGKGQVTVSWTNPGSFFAGVLIVKKAGSAPIGVRDGEKIYNGIGTNFVDTGVAFDTTYFYRAYPYNTKKQYQTLTNVVSVIPMTAKRISELPEGGLVKLKENGAEKLFYVTQHNYQSGLNGQGRTLVVRKAIIGNRQWGTTSQYETSTIDTFLNSSYKGSFSEKAQGEIGEVTIPCTVGDGNPNLTTITRGVFLLSMTKLGEHPVDINIEGEETPIADILKPAQFEGGEAATQWSRTPSNNALTSIWGMRPEGVPGVTQATVSWGVRPAFTLPGDFLLKLTPNNDGSYSPLND